MIHTSEEISGHHDLKTRKAGNKRFIEFHILVAPDMTVEQSQEITRKMSAYISSNLRNATVAIRVKSCDNTCTPKRREDCLIKENINNGREQ